MPLSLPLLHSSFLLFKNIKITFINFILQKIIVIGNYFYE
ncbi:hypothetical protein CHCC14820_0208 [Bacillus paralicheniformis]|uniref:Uncharacterized protein n=1 Tax=Bacillus paralicheniformis TaxID=1648923 RepID=A0ABY3FZ95_9BACI|nr:hypothetical protein SC10_B2orf04873 [Bacillus paralicheniformis]OLG08806.1 hypothetical protein B4125_0382 [Bacillus paralicheniformis]TWJ57963.1 hypothetical protein CHCC5022_4432 [Bacillus paralicheniformis]TWJ74186.1 hypothetical protein CHCC20497_3271 [Bacillus paralicheniformis]TWJ82889.1 hypothetical protein CHCC4186_0827 [Bacillus paralicheniformis]